MYDNQQTIKVKHEDSKYLIKDLNLEESKPWKPHCSLYCMSIPSLSKDFPVFWSANIVHITNTKTAENKDWLYFLFVIVMTNIV